MNSKPGRSREEKGGKKEKEENRSRILVVGTVAVDSVSTPEGTAGEALGGSASYFALAASHYAPVCLLGVVGDDFPGDFRKRLSRENINLDGLETVAGGRTFRWQGGYDENLKEARTIDVSLNVLANYRPRLPESYRSCPYVFLANIDPEVQLSVVESVREPQLVVCDTMNYWLSNHRDRVLEVLAKTDVLIINDEEAEMLTGERRVASAGRKIMGLGPRAAVIKRGEYGAALFTGRDSIFLVPAYPTEKVVDPTGAGDSFGGGFTGFLAETGDFSEENLRRAVVRGIVTASFTVEDFSSAALEKTSRGEIEKRYRLLSEMTSFR